MKNAITFIQPFDATFIEQDKSYLAKYFKLYTINQKGAKGKAFLLFQIRLFFFLIYAIPKSKCIYIWFADYHAFLPVLLAKIFVKKSFIVIGGYDATSIPELKYGSFYRPIRGLITKIVVRNADFLLPVAASLGQKLLARVKSIRGKMIPIPTGYSSNQWYCTSPKKEDLIITVATFDTLSRLRLKGLDFFIEVANKMPAYQFLIIGATAEGRKFLPKYPSNLIVLDKLPQEQLRDYYSKAKVYTQFSLSEGLPNAVCEAMLCECVPIGTDVGGMRSAIGDSGVILEMQDLSLAVRAIQFAIDHQKELGINARRHIVEKFPNELRQSTLLSLLDNA